MAQVNGVNYAQTQTLKTPKVDKGEKNGRVKCLQEEFTFTANVFALNDEILGLSLPKGCKIVDAEVVIPASLGTTGIFSLGFKATEDKDGNAVAEDPNGLVLAADGGGSAARQRMEAAAAGYNLELGAEAQTFLLCTEATDAANGLSISYKVYYIVD
jgi:hypothetical protein